ncbi:MAG TPA: hypothetical protein VLV89_05665 [Candidatus Acidoferrum sp.]|nr:hypothetical protein [Candidatus Acidoferrum sp.]
MRGLAWFILILAFAGTLAPMPALAGATVFVGVVTGADRAVVAKVPAVDGTSVYDGDTVSTEPAGALRLRIGNSQIALAGSTTVTLHKIETGVYVKLLQGTVRFSSVPGSPIEIRALDSLVVRAKGDSAAIGQLSLKATNVFEVGCSKGELAVSFQGANYVVAESTAFRVILDEPNGVPLISKATGAAHWFWIPVLLATPAIAIPAILAPESPSAAQKIN